MLKSSRPNKPSAESIFSSGISPRILPPTFTATDPTDLMIKLRQDSFNSEADLPTAILPPRHRMGVQNADRKTASPVASEGIGRRNACIRLDCQLN
jgi:hypothetical protein